MYYKGVDKHFLECTKLIDLDKERIPRFDDINEKLGRLTGWTYVAGDKSTSIVEFMHNLSRKRFLSATAIRPYEELDFCKLPDVFHDVFGHSALLAYEPFSYFLEELGKLCMVHRDNPTAVAFLANIYWYTAEVGLIMDKGELKYYGGSVISSLSEIRNVYSPATEKASYGVRRTGATPFDSYRTNSIYFVIDSYSELIRSLGYMDEALSSLLLMPEDVENAR